MVIDNVEQDPEKQQDVTIISPQQSLDSESVEEKETIALADNCLSSMMRSRCALELLTKRFHPR